MVLKEVPDFLFDGRNIVVPKYENGNFLGPTILCHVSTDMECYKEEMFGPVLLCMQADSLEEAIAIVNRNRYGNGAAIFTTSGVAARKFQNDVESGLKIKNPNYKEKWKVPMIDNPGEIWNPV